ncbi:MAG TPA: calcium-binding protein, partial [Candidatus Binatia bacterium]|nr:calcium-binding protein [Candidatus Binatia bacterium]
MTSTTLLMSILSMDAYFRGVGGGRDATGGLFVDDLQIGTAEVNHSVKLSDGFGATTYFLDDGSKVIAFRGTDFDHGPNLEADQWYGWITGFGIIGGQALDAIDYYEETTGHDLADGAQNNWILTGHSLGGGLAGFVASLTGNAAYIFDYMPYGAAAGVGEHYNIGIGTVDATNIHTLSTDGEILSGARLLQGVAAALAYGPLAVADPFLYAAVFAAAESGILEASLEQQSSSNLDTHGWSGSSVEAHSIALLSLLQYAQEGNHQDWFMAAEPVLKALYSNDVGSALGLDTSTGKDAPSGQMRAMLAYSALDGTDGLVFGNKGAHSLFDDADDIGAHYSSSSVAEFAKPIAEISTQFAGSLAKHKIEDVDVSGGVVKFYDNTSSVNPNTLVVDLGDNRWTEGGGMPDKIVGQENLVKTALGLADDASMAVPLANLMSTLWGTDDYKLIKSVEIDTTDTGKTIQINEETTPPSGPQKVVMHVAGGGNDSITDSTKNDFISGGGGNDQLESKGGHDLLAGGAGNDTFKVGNGEAVIGGGAGTDTVDYSQLSTSGVTVDSGLSAFASKAVIVGHSTAEGYTFDLLFSVEKLKGSNYDDTFKVRGTDFVNGTVAGLEQVDAGDGNDILDLTDLSIAKFDGVHIPDTTTEFKNFNIVKINSPVTLDAHERLTTYYLGSGDDTISGVGLGSVVYTGGGSDKIDFSVGGAIADLSNTDRIVLGGNLTIHGGLRNRNSADIWANGLGGFVKYGLNAAGELIIRLPWLSSRTVIGANGQPVKIDPDLYILNFAQTMNGYTGAGDITLASYDIQVFRIFNAPAGVDSVGSQLELLGLTIKTIAGTDSGLWHGQDPLVLDLDGDGLDLTYRSSISKSFDLDANYYAGPTAWVLPDDGFLVRDINGDGKINDGTEMFSPSGSGFQGLGLLDGNADGVVNAADNGLADFNGDSVIDSSDVLSDLKVWVDYNQDAITQASELHSLSEYGIVGLNLTTTPVGSKVSGNTVVETASFVRADGTTGMYGEVLLNVDNTNTKYVGPQITVTSQAQSEPDLKGYGTLVNLHQALSRHPEYVSDVDAALASITSNDLTAIKQAIMPILYDWAMGSPMHQADGSVLEGSAADPRNHTFIAIKDYQGHFKDYVYEASSTTVTIGGVDHLDGVWKFASGARVEIIAPENGALPDPTTLHAQYGDYISATPENVTIDGQSVVQTTYTYANGAIVKMVDGFATSTILLGDSGGQAWSPDLGPKIGFYERYMGEKFELNVKPNGTGNFNAALAALDDLATTIDNSLNFLAVRLAIQGSIFSPIFSGMHYDVASDSFIANGSQQLAPMYQSLFERASLETDPIEYLASWKPFIDVLLGNYSQGADLRNTNGFLAQNLIGGFEEATPAYDFLDAVDALGVSRDLFVTGTGQMLGTDEADIFYINGATQTAAGGKSVDNYIFGQNIGNTIVHDEEAGGQAQSEDVLRFTKLNVADVSATREGADLLLTVTATGETIRIDGQFTGPLPNLIGGGNLATDYGVTEIVFADGTVWQKLEMAMAVARALPSGGTVEGTSATDAFISGAGNDLFIGHGSSDLYQISANSGNDEIDDLEDIITRVANDVVVFGGGLTESDLIFERNAGGNDLTIRYVGKSGSLKIDDQFAATNTGPLGVWYLNQMEMFAFDDGSMLTASDIQDLTLATYQTSGNDSIYGFYRDDTIKGGLGNDYMSGGDGSDTYVINLGDGSDEIDDNSENLGSGQTDTIVFGAGISQSDLTFVRAGNSADLTINVGSSGQSVKVDEQFTAVETGPFGTWYPNQVESITFSDGSAMTAADIRLAVIASSETSGNDTIYGFHGDDLLQGGAGDDFMSGGNGNDTYVINVGDGHDEIYDNSGNLLSGQIDTLSFGAGITQADVVFSRAGTSADLLATIGTNGQTVKIDQQFDKILGWWPSRIETFAFSDGSSMSYSDVMHAVIASSETAGNDTVYGFGDDDVLQGGTGDDFMSGGDGNDTYIVNVGDGHDEIYDNSGNLLSGQIDTLSFGSGITQADVTFSRSGNSADLLVTIGTSGQTVKIDQQFDKILGWWPSRIETFAFSDGSSLSYSDVMLAVIASSETAGNDSIYGFGSNDLLDGGAGNDSLYGGDGNDTYAFGRGYGSDTIQDGNGTDTVAFKTGISQSDLIVSRSGVDMVIKLKDPGTGLAGTEQLRIVEQFDYWFNSPIEQFTFADAPGSVLTREDLKNLYFQQAKTSGDDTIIGTQSSDTMAGGAGTDRLEGGDGNDTYIFNLGDGNDTIYDFNGNLNYSSVDTLQLGAGITTANTTLIWQGADLLVNVGSGNDSVRIEGFFNWDLKRIESIAFVDGTVWNYSDIMARIQNNPITGTTGANTIAGTIGPDTIDGLGGTDTVSGNGNADIFKFNSGYGQLTVTQYDASKDSVLQLGSGIGTSNVSVLGNGVDITLFIGSTDQVILKNQYNNPHAGVGSVQFSNGTIWTRQDLINAANAAITFGTTGNDNITGNGGPNTFDGKGGSDYINGNDGNDTFIFNSGYGTLEILEDDFWQDSNSKLQLGAGINPGDIRVTNDNSGKITLIMPGTDKVILNAMASGNALRYGV